MKAKILMMIAGLMLALFSCQKDTDLLNQKTLDDIDFDAVTDAVYEDIFNAAEDASLSVEPVVKGETIEVADCPVITITHPEGALWPKTVTLDYGTGCTGFNENTRAGKIVTVVTGPRLTAGSKRTVTLENYYFNDIKVEGTKVFENKGLNQDNNMVVSVTLTGGKVTFPDGKTIERTVNHEREWIAGLQTRNVFDDECLITGTASGKNRRGVEYTNTIISPLHWTRACKFITEGVVEISITGQDKPATLDYGNGDCDAKAIVTRGDQSKEILLRHRVN